MRYIRFGNTSMHTKSQDCQKVRNDILMIYFLIGAGFGMIFGAIICGIGSSDHTKEDYISGYNEGYHDGYSRGFRDALNSKQFDKGE